MPNIHVNSTAHFTLTFYCCYFCCKYMYTACSGGGVWWDSIPKHLVGYTNYYICQEGYVLSGVCLSVFLSVCLAASVKTADQISAKILREIYLSKRKNWLNFESHPRLDLEFRIREFFERLLHHC